MRNSQTSILNRLIYYKPTKRFFRNSKIGISFLSASLLIITGLMWNFPEVINRSLTKVDLDFGTKNDGAVDILLVGTDSRTDAKGNPLSKKELDSLRAGNATATNTDTIILLRLPKNDRKAVAISIPRDTFLQFPDGTSGKINSIYGMTKENARANSVNKGKSFKEAERIGERAGINSLIKTVDKFLGVSIDHYAEIGLLGFVLLTNAVDGVEVCLKNSVKEPLSGANFKKGKQILNGEDALSFVRQRHGLPRGDLDRITRQQVYMANITSKILSAKTLSNPSKLNELQKAIERSVVIDSELNVLDFASELSDLAAGNVRFVTIPIVRENGWSPDGTQSIVEVNPQKVKYFVGATVAEKKPEIEVADFNKKNFKLNIFNSTLTDGLGTAVSNAFKLRGFNINEVANYNGFPQTKNLIITRNEDYALVDYLKKYVNNTEVVIDENLDENTVSLVVGKTYKGPRKDNIEKNDSSNPKVLTAEKSSLDSNCIN